MIPVLLLLFACKQLPWKGTIAVLLAACCAGCARLVVRARGENQCHRSVERSARLPAGGRQHSGRRAAGVLEEVDRISSPTRRSSATAPVRSTISSADRSPGRPAWRPWPSANPHNQTLAVAIQLGLGRNRRAVRHVAGPSAAVPRRWFRGLGRTRRLSAQNIVGSLFNSHLFDFTQGWGYVIGVGVAGGMIFKSTRRPSRATPGSAKSPIGKRRTTIRERFEPAPRARRACRSRASSRHAGALPGRRPGCRRAAATPRRGRSTRSASAISAGGTGSSPGARPSSGAQRGDDLGQRQRHRIGHDVGLALGGRLFQREVDGADQVLPRQQRAAVAAKPEAAAAMAFAPSRSGARGCL